MTKPDALKTKPSSEIKNQAQSTTALGLLAESIVRMWSDVPVTAIEGAPSSVGLFEQEEISLVAQELAKTYQQVGNNLDLVFLGSATAKREITALGEAESLLGKNILIDKVTAIDIAPQFIQAARRNLGLLQQKGIIKNHQCIVGSLEQVPLSPNEQAGSVTLGLYDLTCLMKIDRETTGEEAGLDEYAGGMSEILGHQTQIIPLFFANGTFSEGTPVVDYDSSQHRHNLNAIRATLKSYAQKHPDLIGMRVLISKEPRNTSRRDQAVFLSTWFNAPNLARVFTRQGFRSRITRPARAQKGFALTLTNNTEKPVKRHATLMNNVLGNLHIDTLNQVIPLFASI